MMPAPVTRPGQSCATVAAGLLWLFCLFPVPAAAETLDAAGAEDEFLGTFAEALDAYGIDVLHNLNDRGLARSRPERPRLGRFPDLPLNTLPDSSELDRWEAAYAAGEIGGLAVLFRGDAGTREIDDFQGHWLDAPAEQRVFVSFHGEDEMAARHLGDVVRAYGYALAWFSGEPDNGNPGPFYATAAQRLAIDSSQARSLRSEVTEFSFLGERVRRDSNSLFQDDGNRGDRSLARREPAVFLKETLGDEFSESTIREIIVPGGVALGETASLPLSISSMRFSAGTLTLLDDESRAWHLPPLSNSELKALFDLVARSEAIQSDAIVDIDERGRVRISSALRDTDVGYAIMHADTLPFAYVPNLPVTKSVVIDTAVDWFPGDNDVLAFETDYEVRFLSADNMRLAQTRVALEYEYHSASDSSSYTDSWGRDTGRLRDSLDYAGLGNSMNIIAHYAGWIGLFRWLRQESVPFLHGRYEFMKLDKHGKETPTRY